MSMKTETTTSSGYGGSPSGLTIFWLEILELAHSGDDAGLAQRLQTLALRQEDLDEIFGPGGARRLWPEYARAFAAFSKGGAADIAKQIRERRLDDVDVVALTGVPLETLSAAERTIVEALRTNAPVYSVHLKRSDTDEGLRIDTFIYLDGGWRTALKVGRRVT